MSSAVKSGTDKGSALTDSFPDAARRHRNDAKHLAANGRFQNAGHLLGFAAECLAKEVLQNVGIIIDKPSAKYWSHFPDLAVKIRRDGRTRIMVLLLPIVSRSTFLDGWKAESRYEANMPQGYAEMRYKSWQADVDSLFVAAGIP